MKYRHAALHARTVFGRLRCLQRCRAADPSGGVSAGACDGGPRPSTLVTEFGLNEGWTGWLGWALAADASVEYPVLGQMFGLHLTSNTGVEHKARTFVATEPSTRLAIAPCP